MTWVRFPTGKVFSFFRHRIQTAAGTHPASYTMDTGNSFSLGKASGTFDPSPPSSADFRNAWSYTSTPPYVFVAWYFVNLRDKFNTLWMRQLSCHMISFYIPCLYESVIYSFDHCALLFPHCQRKLRRLASALEIYLGG